MKRQWNAEVTIRQVHHSWLNIFLSSKLQANLLILLIQLASLVKYSVIFLKWIQNPVAITSCSFCYIIDDSGCSVFLCSAFTVIFFRIHYCLFRIRFCIPLLPILEYFVALIRFNQFIGAKLAMCFHLWVQCGAHLSIHWRNFSLNLGTVVFFTFALAFDLPSTPYSIYCDCHCQYELINFYNSFWLNHH